MKFASLLRAVIPQSVLEVRRIYLTTRPLHERTCPLCGFQGKFGVKGRPPRLDARCMRCGSLERHRLFWLWFRGDSSLLPEPILHFAPEPILVDRFRQIYRQYRTADLYENADLKLDIEDIRLESGSINTVICNHVLEHVDDGAALSEIYRVLSNGGVMVCSVPIIEGWDVTYENDEATSPRDRELHFGQNDHIRYYGRDFRDRLQKAGFAKIDEITAEGPDVIQYGLVRGEKLFVCRKLASSVEGEE